MSFIKELLEELGPTIDPEIKAYIDAKIEYAINTAFANAELVSHAQLDDLLEEKFGNVRLLYK